MATFIGTDANNNITYQVEPSATKTMLPNTGVAKFQDEIAQILETVTTYKGQPVVVTSAEDMTEETVIYLYMGEEEGYNSDHWYYYDTETETWTDGGAYVANPVIIDDTLTQAGEAADAKVTGDELTQIKSDFEEVSDIVGQTKFDYSVQVTNDINVNNSNHAVNGKVGDTMIVNVSSAVLNDIELRMYLYYTDDTQTDFMIPVGNDYSFILAKDVKAVAFYQSGLSTGTVYIKVTVISTSGQATEIQNIERNLVYGEVDNLNGIHFYLGYVNSAGSISTTSTAKTRYAYSDLIPVYPGADYHYTLTVTSPYEDKMFLAMYDNSQTFVKEISFSNESTLIDGKNVSNHRVTIPDDIYYVRLTFFRGTSYKVGFNLYIGTADFDIPSYYHTNGYIKSKIDRIESLCRDAVSNGDAFIFITDEHWAMNARQSTGLISYISKRTNISKLISGGDTCNYGQTENGIPVIKLFTDALKKSFPYEIHHVVGNHEYFANATGSNLYYYFDMYNRDQIGNADRHYYYVDNPQQKMRYVILSSFHHIDTSPYVEAGYEADQISWLENVALNVETGWGIIVFTHYLRGMGSTISLDVENALDAYNGNGELIAIIEGHTHYDYHTATTGGIPIIAVTCDKNEPWIDNNVDMEPWLSDRTSGTIKEQAFDVFVLDRTNKTITQIRIGCPIRDGIDPETWTEYQEVVTSYNRN